LSSPADFAVRSVWMGVYQRVAEAGIGLVVHGLLASRKCASRSEEL